MKRESSWGFAGILAVAATVGIAVQPWSQGTASPGEGTSNLPALTTEEAAVPSDFSDACSGVAGVLADFLATEKSSVGGPDFCYSSKPPVSAISRNSSAIAGRLGEMKFVVATVPDPVHTHLALTFDRFAESIQQAAQDDGYLLESSWLPWDDDKGTYDRLSDQSAANRRKGDRENQPGIVLFRRPLKKSEQRSDRTNALAVFVVGEEATAGIHREQFRNASGWIEYLSGMDKNRTLPVAMLGPSFSGSFSSLDQLLSDAKIWARLKPRPDSVQAKKTIRLAVYSGSANGGEIVADFRNSHQDSLDFHSFLQDDDVLLDSFKNYVGGSSFGDSSSRFAILSEDETAFGRDRTARTSNRSSAGDVLSLSYPRDISSLRSAYQSKSVFGTTSSSAQSEARGRNLPTDLADSAGKTHDTVRTYAGNQSPLAQEAYLLSIVNRLLESRSNYLVLRGTNSLDILFLANFFRRALPDARIVIDSPDTLFQRERGATSLSGTMVLATYPLFVQEQDWTGDPQIQTRRYFKSEVSEGVYIALRLLLNSDSLQLDSQDPTGCRVADDEHTFLPSVVCSKATFLPDYTPPLWLGSQCGSSDDVCKLAGPVGWLSVIGRNTFWPLATLKNGSSNLGKATDWTRPEAPVSIKLVLISVLLLSLFHCWCCFSASFTSKPAFLAHFATIEDSHHDLLIAIGCFSIAAMSLWIGWGTGFFLDTSRPFEARWPIAICVFAIWISSASAYLGSYLRNSQLAGSQKSASSPMKRLLLFSLASVVFLLIFAVYLELQVPPENRFLTHWRSVHLGSGVSPLVPALLIAAGIYVWFWYSLHGLALFGKERCLLPGFRDLALRAPNGEELHALRIFSMEDVGAKIEPLAKPLSGEVVGLATCLTVVFFAASYFIEQAFPLHSLGSSGFSVVIDFLFCSCLGFMFAETWQLYRVWGKLHRLLSFLDYIPLRRTLAALHGFSWGRLWKMSGNVLDVRYKLLSRQLESRNHLATSLREKIASTEKDLPGKWSACLDVFKQCDVFLGIALPMEVAVAAKMAAGGRTVTSPAPQPPDEKNRIFSKDLKEGVATIDEAIEAGEKYITQLKAEEKRKAEAEKLCASLISVTEPLRELAGLVDAMNAITELQSDATKLAIWYAGSYRDPKASNLEVFTDFQRNSAKAAGLILSRVLAPQWRKEGHSLVIVPHEQGKNEESRKAATPSLAAEAYIQNAEEFVSFPFLGFVQNILGRMRTIVIGILALFIAVTLAVSSYPFDPRHTISIALAAVFVILGSVITYVYADMHRDSTLSHLTDTTPGELGSEFWFKIVGFGIGPFIGLMAAIFPEIGDFVISWLQPGINSVK